MKLRNDKILVFGGGSGIGNAYRLGMLMLLECDKIMEENK